MLEDSPVPAVINVGVDHRSSKEPLLGISSWTWRLKYHTTKMVFVKTFFKTVTKSQVIHVLLSRYG